MRNLHGEVSVRAVGKEAGLSGWMPGGATPGGRLAHPSPMHPSHAPSPSRSPPPSPLPSPPHPGCWLPPTPRSASLGCCHVTTPSAWHAYAAGGQTARATSSRCACMMGGCCAWVARGGRWGVVLGQACVCGCCTDGERGVAWVHVHALLRGEPPSALLDYHMRPGCPQALRACLLCRTPTHSITPSSVWPGSAEEKAAIQEAYRSKLATIDCMCVWGCCLHAVGACGGV